MSFLRNVFKNKQSDGQGKNKQEKRTQTDFRSRQWHTESGQGRGGDGTALGDAISKGLYQPQAGSERMGYFDPEIAPFRVFPNGETGLLYDPKWDQLIPTIQAKQAQLRATGGVVYDQPFDENMLGKFTALAIAIKLGLPSIQEVLTAFQRVIENESVATFLAGTTVTRFFFTYTTEAVWFSEEVASELMLNALANLLLKDSGFSCVHTASALEAKAAALLEERRQEMKNPW